MKRCLAAAVILGLITACSSSGDHSEVTDPELGPNDLGSSGATVPDLPTAEPAADTSWLAARSELDELGRTLDVRLENAINDCMARLGFEYEPVANSLAGSPDQVWFGDFNSDVEWAQKYGYSSPALVESFDEPEGELAVTDENYFIALMGETNDMTEVTSPLSSVATMSFETHGGCEAEADVAVFGSVEAGEQYIVAYEGADSILYELLLSADASAELVEPLNAWRKCVADRGFATSGGPADLRRQTTSDRYSGDEIAAEVPPGEIRVAVADHTCRAQVGLETAYEQVLNSYLEPQVDLLNTQMDALRRLSIPPRDNE